MNCRSSLLSCLAAVLLVCAMSVSVMASDMAWKIKSHSLDFSELKAEVDAIVKDGFIPVGMSVNKDKLYILYVNSPIIDMDRWTISRYYSLDELTAGITDKMKNGYVPMGYASYNGTHYLLYIVTEHSGTAWRLVPTDLDAEAVKTAIQGLAAQGYAPMAINADQGQYQVLLVQLAQGALENWQIGSFEANGNAIKDGVNTIAVDGYIPWGVFVGDARVNILFVQPRGGLDAVSILTGGDSSSGLPEAGVGEELDESGQDPAMTPGAPGEETSPAAAETPDPLSDDAVAAPDADPEEGIAPDQEDQDPAIEWKGVDETLRQDILAADVYWRGGIGKVCGSFADMLGAFPPETSITIRKEKGEGGMLLSVEIVPPSGQFAPNDHAGFLLDIGYAPDSATFIEALRSSNERNWQDGGDGLKLDLFGGQITWAHPNGYRAMTETDHRLLMAYLTNGNPWGGLTCKE